MPDIRIHIHRNLANLYIESEVGRRWVRINMDVDYLQPYITINAEAIEELIDLMKKDDLIVEN